MRRGQQAPVGSFILALAASVSSCTPARDASTPPHPALRRVTIGACEDYPEESRSLADVRSDFELMRELGLDTLRVSLGWDAIEPERDRYDLEFWDAFVDLAVRQYGIRLLPYVAYTPAWNSTGGGEDHWKAPPREPAEFAELMGLLAARYRGRIGSWELWNEPDNRDYWLGTAADYAALVRLGAEAIDAVDPDIDVVSGGLAGHVEFLAELFDQHGVARHLDVVNLHAYYETWNPEPLETLSRYVGEAAEVLQRHGRGQALWMAEIGYGNYREGSRVSAYTSAFYRHEHTLEYQAVMLVRSVAILLDGPVSLIAWYELKDPPATDAMIGDVNNRHLGVTFVDRRPKPAAAALAFCQRLFADGFQSATRALRVDAAGGASAAMVHGFTTGRQTLVIVAWLATPPRPSTPAAGPGDAIDARRVRVRVRAPHVARGPALHYDAQGREKHPREKHPREAPGRAALGRERSARPASSPLELELELTGDDVQIVEIPIR